MKIKQSIILSGCIVCLLVMLLYITFSDRGLADLFHLKSERNRLIQENERLKQENLSLFRTIERLRSDPDYIESIARKELGMIKKDEVILTPKDSNKK
jgi:cell division protein FtsB